MELLQRAAQHSWYHTLELAPGVWTDGWFDLRQNVEQYGLPADMTGMRALEVGTWDGFWAFEMESRGAEVLALDLEDERQLDWPPRRRPASFPEPTRGDGFKMAHELRESRVQRVVGSIYDTTPDDLGQFDLVFCGSVLIHLRDQLLALERIANLVKPGGMFIGAEEYDRLSGLVPFAVSRYRADRESAVVFWQPSIRTWLAMLWSAGFDRVEQHAKFVMQAKDFSVRHVVLHGHKNA